jgi:uridine kinase
VPEPHPTSFVIAVSSVLGGGKTTLVKRTAELLDGASTLFLDDYEMERPKDLHNWIRDGADMNEWKTPQFVRDVRALRNGESIVYPVGGTIVQPTEYVVIEDPMGRTRDEIAENIDLMVFIDTPIGIGLVRQLLRDYIDHTTPENMENATKEEYAQKIIEVLTSMKSWLHLYLDVFGEAYGEALRQVKPSCDLVLDWRLQVDRMAKQIAAAAKEGQRRLKNQCI